MKKSVVNAWDFIFNSDVSPLRHIPDVSTRHYVLQALGFMWVLAFSLAIGSYAFFAFNLIGHVVLIGAATITIATYTTATIKPTVFGKGSGRRADGEHE
jgi:hypothetical protein